MNNKQTTRRLFTILLMLMLGTFCPAALVRAQKPAAAKAASPASGPKEGIKVHGHWTIEVRNPDGKLVERREFKNGLQNSGSITLGHFLQRTAKAGEWAIELGDVGNTVQNTPCLTDTQQPTACVIYEPGSQYSNATAPRAFRTLTISSSQPNSSDTVLTGSATAQRDGIIRTVRTILSSCPVDTQGVCQPGSSFFSFTLKSVSPNINVVAGQIIQVTVVISFS